MGCKSKKKKRQRAIRSSSIFMLLLLFTKRAIHSFKSAKELNALFVNK